MNEARDAWSSLWSSWRARLDRAQTRAGGLDEELALTQREIAAAVTASPARYGEAIALTLLVSTARAARDGSHLDWASATNDGAAQALCWLHWAQALDGEPRQDALRLAIATGESELALLEAAPLVDPSTRELLIAGLRRYAARDDWLRPSALLTVAVLELDEEGFVAELEALRHVDPDDAIPLTSVSDAALAHAGYERLRTWPAPERLRLGGWLVPQLDGDERTRAAAAQVADYALSDRPDLWLGHADRLAGYLERKPLDRLLAVWTEHAPLYRATDALRRLAELGSPEQAVTFIGDFERDAGRRHQQLVALRGLLAACPPPLETTLAERMCTHEAAWVWPDVLAAAPASTIDDVVKRAHQNLALDGRLRVWAALPGHVLGAHAASWLGAIQREPDAAPLLALAARADALDTPTQARLLALCLEALARTSRPTLLGGEDHQGLSALTPLLSALGGSAALAESMTALRGTLGR